MNSRFDITIVGGGIVGLSTALRLRHHFPTRSVLLLEKEPVVASHQTGRNSGVVHSGVYYEPGSLKAQLCRAGAHALERFCQKNGLPFDRRGKLLVAADKTELARLADLHHRCEQNGLSPRWVDQAELQAIEPNIVGERAVLVPSSAITDFGAVAKTMADLFIESGGVIQTGHRVESITERASCVVVNAEGELFRSERLIACGGLMADRLAEMCGLDLDFKILPFRGEYFRLSEAKKDIIYHLIYPVPDPKLPFLGIHLTPGVDGSVTVGPNAVLAFAREGYKKTAIHPKDLAEVLSFAGSRKLLKSHWRSAATELRNSASRRRYLTQCQKYCPGLERRDLEPHPAGIRAQAVLNDGTLVKDFLIERTARTIHICNAPSPAATSSLAIADYVAGQVSHGFGWPRTSH